ncbi:MAG TPA: alpha/beta hydrolase [Kofleriaceae bacterium]|nr:alpha/beta hydrolase [Kofleriaceae bacterium]
MPAQLHHEPIAKGTPAQWLIALHGILGSGGNWRGIARKVTERRPEWGIALVDLRNHGRSEHGAPPNTVEACAEDVRALAAQLGGVTAIAGHSFGGKVALATRAFGGMRQTWMFDASPGARPDRAEDSSETVAQLLALMEKLPRTWTKRDDFVDAVVAAGHPKQLAQWLAMNVDPAATGYALRLDLAAIREMIADYLARDLWASALDPAFGELELVIATRSDVVNAADRARVTPPPPHVHVELVDAGHWLHIDAAAAVVDLLATRLPGVG